MTKETHELVSLRLMADFPRLPSREIIFTDCNKNRTNEISSMVSKYDVAITEPAGR